MHPLIMNAAKKGHMSMEQKNIMLQFLEQHPNLRSGKFTNQFRFKHAQQLWIQLANLLNAVPGANKQWKQWRKTWQDYKGSVKKRNAALKTDMTRTGGGPPSTDFLKTEEEIVIEMMGVAAAEGHPDIVESDVTFNENATIDNTEIVEADITINENVQPLHVEHDYITHLVNQPEDDENINPLNEETETKKSLGTKKKKLVHVQRLDKTILATEKLAIQNQLKIDKRETLE